MFFHSSKPEPERPADPAVRRANLRRVVRLFKPYRGRLAALLALIVFSAGLGVIPALLREFRIETLAEDLRPGAVARRGLDLVPISEGMIQRPATELAPFLRTGLQRRGSLARRPVSNS